MCTATQPLLDQVGNPQRALTVPPENEIIEDVSKLFKALKRVTIVDATRVGGWPEEEICALAKQCLDDVGSVLVVVNTRQQARSMFDLLNAALSNTEVYLLSTSMCATHRRKMLWIMIVP